MRCMAARSSCAQENAIVEVLELDPASPAGAALLRSTAERHGEAIARLAGRLQRMFVLASPWAPGLSFVGAQASSAVGTLSLAGSGETLEEALASCVGEAAERLSQIERPGDVLSAPPSAASADMMPAARGLVEAQLCVLGPPEPAVDWMRARVLGEADPRAVLVPADWCLRRVTPGPLRDANAALSTGAAAAATPTSAAYRALLELIERDAAALWWIGGRRGRPLACDGPAAAEAHRILVALRRGVTTRATWLLDITSDIGVPVLAAVSAEADGRGLAFGLGARLSVAGAARAAILELCQIELGLQIARLKLAQRGDAGLTDLDRHHLRRAREIDAEACVLLHPAGIPHYYSEPGTLDDERQLGAVSAALARKSIAAAIVDLARADIGLPTAKAIAPALQPLPSGKITDRLAKAISAHGGGGRWTGGVPLT